MEAGPTRTNYEAVVPEGLRKHVEGITPSPEQAPPSRWPGIVKALVLAAYTWHKMEYRNLGYAERLDLVKEVLGIEPQVLLESLGQDHPVHYYLRDMMDPEPSAQPNICGVSFESPDGKQGGRCHKPRPCPNHDALNYAQSEGGGKLIETHDRPYVVPTRKHGDVVMLVGKTEVRLSPHDAAGLASYLLLVAGAAPREDDTAGGRTHKPQRITLQVSVKDGDEKAATTGVGIQGPGPDGILTFVGDGRPAGIIRDRVLADARRALGISDDHQTRMRT